MYIKVTFIYPLILSYSMTDPVSRMHAWSHFVLFVMVLLIVLAVMKFSGPTGLAAGNQTITAQSVIDLSPFLTAVGLLIALSIVVAIILNSRIGYTKQHHTPLPKTQTKKTANLNKINTEISNIRRKLKR